MNYLTAIIAFCFMLVGCGAEGPSRSVAESERSAPSADQRPRDTTVGAALPVTTDSLRLRNVTIDRASARRVVRLGNGWAIWMLRGDQTGPAVLTEGAAVVCLAIIDRTTVVAAKCAAESVLAVPERSMIVLSGGAAGAPGLRPREVIVVGALAHAATRVSLMSDGRRPVDTADSIYWLRTRAAVRGIAFEQANETLVMELDACQRC